jgi:hypothetical protein
VTAYAVQWQVIDVNDRPIGVLNGSGGNIAWDGKATVQRICRGVSFPLHEWEDINPLTDWLRPVMRLADGTERPLGVFGVAGDPQRYLAKDLRAAPQPYLMDSGLLLNTPSPFNLSGKVSDKLRDVMVNVIESAGITKYKVDTASEILNEPVAYPVGTLFSVALAGFARLAGFYPPHFDRHGVLQMKAFPTGELIPDASYDSSTIVVQSRLEDSDLFTAPNTFIVVGSGATDGPVVAVAEIPSGAPNSVANRNGRRITSVITEQGISTFAQAERIAKLTAATSIETNRSITFGTVPNYDHDCYSAVQVNDIVYRELSWDLPLSPTGPMSHEVNSSVEVFVNGLV